MGAGGLGKWDRVQPEPHHASMLAGEHEWKLVSTGITDCYFNVTELPPGSTAKFRVACVNKAGQGPYSTTSGKVHLEATGKLAVPVGQCPQRALRNGAAAARCFADSSSRALDSGMLLAPCSCIHTPQLSSWLSFLPADSRAAPTKNTAVPIPDKAASSRSTQTPQAQLEPPASGLPPATPPRKHKAALQKPEQPLQPGVPEGAKPDSKLPDNITVCEPPELVFTAPQTAAMPHTGTTAAPTDTSAPTLPTRVSPQPRAPSPSKPSPTPSASTTPNTAPTRKMPPYMVTSFVSMPPASPPAQEAPASTRSSKEPSGDSRAPDGTALRQGVPQKPYTFLDEKAR